MKPHKIVIIVVIMLFVMVLTTIGAGAFFYKQYNQKVAHFEQQDRYMQAQLKGVENSLDSFKNSLEGLHFQFKDFVKELNAIESQWKSFTQSSTEEGKKLFSRVDAMHREMQQWQTEYSSSLQSFQETLRNLKNQIGMAQEGAQQVELGEIAVEK